MIVGVIILISALTILPALALGPLVEQLSTGGCSRWLSSCAAPLIVVVMSVIAFGLVYPR